MAVEQQESTATEKPAKGKKGAVVRKKKKSKKNVSEATVVINATFNNTIVTFADKAGQVLAWSSAGHVGFKGSKKSTPFAAQIAAEDASNKAREHGVRSADIVVIGPGAGRETAIKAIGMAGIQIREIHDRTPIPHNGCRPPKKRRM